MLYKKPLYFANNTSGSRRRISTLAVFLLGILLLLLSFSNQAHTNVHLKINQCERPPKEVLFNTIVRGLFEEGIVPPGDILDIGSNDGHWACFYGCLDQGRKVHAVEPNPLLAESISCPTTNVKAYNMAMSSKPGKINFKPRDKSAFVGDLASKMAHDGNITVTTLDNFFNSKSLYPGFMHLDVEGYEQDLIKGGVKIITKHLPLFSYEVHLKTPIARSTIEEVEKVGYVSYMVNELCGVRQDCRNLLAFPVKDITRYKKSTILNLAVHSKALVRIKSADINDVFMKHNESALAWGVTIPSFDDLST